MVAAVRTALSWREKVILTSPLWLPPPPDPGRTFAWPGSELPAHPAWQTLCICPTSQARLAADQRWAHVSSRQGMEEGRVSREACSLVG